MIKVIKTEDDYDVALEEIELLVDLDPEVDTPEADRLEVMTLLVQDYETRHYALSLPDPIEAIRFRMDQQGLKQTDLVPYIGSRSKVSEVLSGKRALTLPMARGLHSGLGISARALLQERDPSVLEETDIEWRKFPLREMSKRGWIRDKVTNAREQAEDLVRGFFDESGLRGAAVVMCRQGASRHVRSGRGMDNYALAAWACRVVTLGKRTGVEVGYEPGVVTPDFMRAVAQLSWSDKGPLLAQEYLANHGVALVIEPHLQRTYLDGAAIFVEDMDRPVIGLTARYDRLDNFWFCLMHELAHVAAHMGRDAAEFYDDLDAEDRGDHKEEEADGLARDSLIPRAEWDRSAAKSSASPSAVQALAKELNIHPAIVAGRVRYERKSYRILKNLVGHGEVRKHFPNIQWS